MLTVCLDLTGRQGVLDLNTGLPELVPITGSTIFKSCSIKYIFPIDINRLISSLEVTYQSRTI